MNMKLNVYYDSETDTLSLWNGQPASEGADVSENLTADFDAEGEVVGFTLEHASEMLKAIGAHPFPASGHEGLTPVGSEHALEMLKAAGARPFPAWGYEGLMPEGGKHALEIGDSLFIMLSPEDLTPEGIAKLGGHLIARSPEDSQFADSGK